MQSELSRRDFLGASATSVAASGVSADDGLSQEKQGPGPRCRPPVRAEKARHRLAVVATAYYYLSHAYHICGRFLDGYFLNGRFHWPDWAIAGMHVEQRKRNDLSGELARRHGFHLSDTIAGALTLGGAKLAVDGVLLIGEHGDYPYNARGQKLYPRYRMFQSIVEVFRKANRTVPVFCDKHLSYDRNQAREMVNTARKMGFPLFAGSSLPVTWRRPELELPLGIGIREAIVAYSGELEILGFHALEALQCMVERRTRGQQGVRAVTCLEGDAVWKAGDAGLWSWELLEHALGRSPSLNVGDIRHNCRNFLRPAGRPTFPNGPAAYIVEYRDGLKGAALLLNGHVSDPTFAARLVDRKNPVSTWFVLPPPPGASFLQALANKIEGFLHTGRPPYPIERTLLTGGMLDLALESRARGYRRIETPDLDVRYDPPKDSGFMRGDYVNPVA